MDYFMYLEITSVSGALIQHERIHSGEKLFACSKCDKEYTQSNNLKKHELTHTGDIPFTYSKFDQAFTQKGHVLSHNMTHT